MSLAVLDSFLAGLQRWLSELAGLLAFDPALLLQTEILLRLIAMAGLMVLSAFFSSSETALFSLSRMELREIRRSGHPAADIIHELLDQPRRLIISILCGNELVNIAASANMAAILLQLYPADRVLLVNLLVMVPLLLLLCEVTPKTIAVTNPALVSTRLTAAPMALWVRLVAPLRALVRVASEKVTTMLVGPEKAPENILRLDEFRTLVEEVVESGELHAIERVLIDNLLAAGSTDVVEIMIPRTRMAAVDSSLPLPELFEQVRRLRHRRVPVYGPHREVLLGMLHAEDLMQRVLDGEDPAGLTLEELLHEVVMVPPGKKVDELFNFFLEHKTHAAVVINEFGGIDGMVTLRGAIRFIFGNAFGTAEPVGLRLREDGSHEVDGVLPLDDFCELTGIERPRDDSTTVGGLMLARLDRLPRPGDRITVQGLCLQVETLEGHRIATVRVSREAGDGGEA